MPNVNGTTGLRLIVHKPDGSQEVFFPVMNFSVDAESYILGIHVLDISDPKRYPPSLYPSFNSGQWAKVEVEP